MTEERRLKLLDLARRYDVLILEDSPYRELRYEGEPVKPIYRLDGTGQVIGLYTFSKILFPGMRLGWVIADEAIIQKLVTAMQAADLCPPPFNQAIVAEFAERGLLDKNIARVKTIYREKREVMLKALDEFMPRMDGLMWTRPQGGLFLWLTLPEHMDADEMFYEAVEQNVAYVVGSAFHCDGGGRNSMRLNFSYPTKEEIVEGVKRLGKVIQNYDRVKARSRVQTASP
jgi:2-aminoadipate transaminase